MRFEKIKAIYEGALVFFNKFVVILRFCQGLLCNFSFLNIIEKQLMHASLRHDLRANQVALEGPCGFQSPAFAMALGVVRILLSSGVPYPYKKGLIGLR